MPLAIKLVEHRAEHPVLRLRNNAAGIAEHECASAIGRFGFAGRQAALPDGCRLLIARHAANRDRGAEQVCMRKAKLACTINHLRQSSLRHAKKVAQLIVPAAPVERHEHCAAGIAGICDMSLAAGQLPCQPAFHRSQRQPAIARGLRHGLIIIEQPAHLGAGEIGIEQQTGFGLHHLLMPRLFQRRAEIRRPPVLPDDGARQGLAAMLVPSDDRLALVGNANRSNPSCPARLLHHVVGAGEGLVPNLGGIMLDPARAGIMLRQFRLSDTALAPVLPKQHGPRAGGAFIQDKNGLIDHWHSPPAKPYGAYGNSTATP